MQKQARLEAKNKAQQLLKSKPIFLDTETTGHDERAEIVEISIIDHDGAVLVDTLVKPQRRIPDEVIRIHNITNELVADAPKWPDVWPAIEDVIRSRSVGIYNAEFDIRMMQQTHQFNWLNWTLPDDAFFCIMKLYAKFYGDWNPARRSFRWHSLENARRQCNLSFANTHRAKDDALLARAVLLHMANTA